MRDYKNYFSGKRHTSFESTSPASGKKFRFSFSSLSFKGLMISTGILLLVSLVLALAGMKRLSHSSQAVSHIGTMIIEQQIKDYLSPRGLGGSEPISSNANKDLHFYFYEIQPGENLASIAKKLGTSMDSLISLNSIDNAHFLKPGNKILVPNMDGVLYVVKKDDTLDKIAKKYKVSVDDILDYNDIEEDVIGAGDILFLPGASLTAEERAKALGYLFIKPVRGRFTSGFGIRIDPFTGGRGYHAGIDIAARYGTPIRASKEGRVTFVGWKGGYGLCVIIKHQMGYETVYGHLAKATVKEGQYVNQGQTIGKMGNTGRSTGTHLHFEVRRYGKPINPTRLQGLGKASRRWY
ncbi:MAG: M23 family metallopeptidase [Brevinematales bacterium]|nr:M23 family metallopeptidase [Brevinematales bacterium]